VDQFLSENKKKKPDEQNAKDTKKNEMNDMNIDLIDV